MRLLTAHLTELAAGKLGVPANFDARREGCESSVTRYRGAPHFADVAISLRVGSSAAHLRMVSLPLSEKGSTGCGTSKAYARVAYRQVGQTLANSTNHEG